MCACGSGCVRERERVRNNECACVCVCESERERETEIEQKNSFCYSMFESYVIHRSLSERRNAGLPALVNCRRSKLAAPENINSH